MYLFGSKAHEPDEFPINKGNVKDHSGQVMKLLREQKTLKYLKEEVNKQEANSFIICCEKKFRKTKYY